MQDLGLAKNRGGLGAMLLWSGEPRTDRRRRTATLDLDSLPLEVFGHQPGAEWNGHYRMCCYHPLVVRSDEGVFLGAKLRPGNVHTADGGLAFVLPVLRRARAWAERVWLRIDAGFPEPRLLATLEEEGFLYVARLKSNAALERLAAPHLASPLASAPGEAGVRTHELLYRAGSWAHARRVVLVIVERTDEQGELFTDHFFLLSNASVAEIGAEALLAHYRQRGTAEKDFGDWKQALDLSLSSTPRAKAHYRGRQVEEPHAEPDSFAANEARLLLSLVAANLLHAGAELLRREGAASVSRERFRELLLKSAGRVLTGGRRIRFLIDSTRAALWRAFMRALNQHYPTRGSPMIRTLPDPA